MDAVPPTGMVSGWFAWEETYASETAERLGIDNTPPAAVRPSIVVTAHHMDRVRKLLAAPVLVSSWYRSLALNRAIGSKDTSQHVAGVAVDFRAPQYGSPAKVFDYLRALRHDLAIDQLILEFAHRPSGGWVHISFTDAPRFQALIIDDQGTRLA